jgi:hypothetical protein
VRDTSSWRRDLLEDLRRASFPEDVMPAEAFCAVELGLHFLTCHFPGRLAAIAVWVRC